MGNKIARTTQASASEYYLHDLPSSYNLVLKEVLGRGRFLKSIQCKHDEGLVLVKVYFKRGDYIDLKEYERRLFKVREILQNVQNPHVWPFQFWLETDKAAYLLRQYFFSNLLDRLITRPFLSLVEKKWLAFQLLDAVKQSHENGVCHGDIKCENILVTSWNWLYLADFASFKPTYIPDDDPSDFSFFFDNGGRRLCYLAPERFYEHGDEVEIAADASLKPSMDIFSVGCVFAELFLEGQPLFELSQLLAYRRGHYDPSQCLEKIPDVGLRQMILHMIQLDPESRLSAQSYLQNYVPYVLPSYFSPFLHKFFSCLSPLDSDTRVALTQGAFSEILKQIANKSEAEPVTKSSTSALSLEDKSSQQVDNSQQNLDSSNCVPRHGVKQDEDSLVSDINTLLQDVVRNKCLRNKDAHENLRGTACNVHLELTKNKLASGQKKNLALKGGTLSSLRKVTKSDYKLLMSEYDSLSDTFGMSFFCQSHVDFKYEGMVLISSLICSCLRSVKLPQLRRGAILMLRCVSLYIDDEERLQHVIPYVISMLSDTSAIVRCAALETICDVLSLVQDFPPSDAKIFPEYILPMLSTLPDDPEESVRICYASNLYKIAITAYHFLIHSYNHSGAGSISKSNAPTYSLLQTELLQLRKSLAAVVQDLAMGPKQTLKIWMALLQNIGNLCSFFGKRLCNDFLLPILPAFLNDRDDQLRATFYSQIIFVCFFVGQRSIEDYLLPYIEQALSDPMEAVIVSGAECLSLLCKDGLLQKRILLKMIEKALPLLSHPSGWVRRSVIGFVIASSESLGPVDTYVYLAPVLHPFLRRQPASLSSEKDIISCLKPPISRQAFYQALETVQCSDMLERQRKIWYNSSACLKQHDDLHGRSHEDVKQHLDSEDCCKLRKKQNLICNSTSSVDVRNPLCLEKLQFSGFIAPQSASSSFISNGQSEGIPLYSFHMDKQTVAAGTSCSEFTLHWNSVGVGSSFLPWADFGNKSFSLTGSASPKLVCGSFLDVHTELKKSYKREHDTYRTDNDQTTSVTCKFQDMDPFGGMKDNISISSEESPEVTDFPYFLRGPTISDNGWKPRGVLLAHLQEHRAAVSDIAVSNEHSFFISASSDSTVKIWDTRKLEKDISFKSRLTYALDGPRALCATMLCGSTQVVVGADDGTMHLFSVDCISRGLGSIVERYSGIADIRKKQVGEGPILWLTNYGTDGIASHLIMYSTQRCGIHLWDTRTSMSSWTLRAIPEEGYISSFVTGPCGNWFVSGSSRGVITLWDLRFLIPVNSWQYTFACPVEKMCLYVPPSGSTCSLVRPLVYVAAGFNEVSLWNAENGSCHQVLRLANYGNDLEMPAIPSALAKPRRSSTTDSKHSPNSKYRIDDLTEPSPRLPGVRSLLPLAGGDLLTGGTDMRIRLWDHNSPHHTYCVCGPSMKGVMMNDEIYETTSCFGVQVVQERSRKPQVKKFTSKDILKIATADSAGCHRDSILALASAKQNQRLLISSCRDGAIKVWK